MKQQVGFDRDDHVDGQSERTPSDTSATTAASSSSMPLSAMTAVCLQTVGHVADRTAVHAERSLKESVLKTFTEREGDCDGTVKKETAHEMKNRLSEIAVGEQTSNKTVSDKLLETTAANVKQSEFDINDQSFSTMPPTMRLVGVAERMRRMDHRMLAGWEEEDSTDANKKSCRERRRDHRNQRTNNTDGAL